MNVEASTGGPRLDYLFGRFIAPCLLPAAALGMRLQAEGRLRPVPVGTLFFLIAHGPTAPASHRPLFSILVRFAPGLAVRERGFLQGQHTPTMFAVRDLLKDLDLGLRTYGDAGVAMPLTRQARELFAAAMPESADLDITAVARDS